MLSLIIVVLTLIMFAIWWALGEMIFCGSDSMTIILTFGFAAAFIALCYCGVVWTGAAWEYSQSLVVDEKIAMYEEENVQIENSVRLIIGEYIDLESEEYLKYESGNLDILVALVPELKYNSLVNNQRYNYMKNSNEIKALKTAKLDAKYAKWLLYFDR